MENAAELQTPDTPSLTDEEHELLRRARHVADTVLAPNAQAVDRGSEPPVDNLRALARAGLIGVTTPQKWGGKGASGAFQREYTETLTAACGTTWFVLTQHLGACGMLAGSENPLLRERYLRAMAAGDHFVGVGFGHLRRPDPLLRAREENNGYTLSGVAPWVTGWPLLKGVIFGATLEEADRHVYVYVAVDEANEAVRSSPPLPLCAMNASATTEVHLDNLFVPRANWVKFSSRAEMMRGDQNNIAGAVSPPLGCARGSLQVLRGVADKRKSAPLTNAADRLEAEINACRTEARRWAEGPKDTPAYKPGALNARAWAIELGVRAAHQAVAASGGGANALDHPAQRLFREAMFYTLTAQTSDIQIATLEKLSRP